MPLAGVEVHQHFIEGPERRQPLENGDPAGEDEILGALPLHPRLVQRILRGERRRRRKAIVGRLRPVTERKAARDAPHTVDHALPFRAPGVRFDLVISSARVHSAGRGCREGLDGQRVVRRVLTEEVEEFLAVDVESGGRGRIDHWNPIRMAELEGGQASAGEMSSQCPPGSDRASCTSGRSTRTRKTGIV